ncbi:amino acid ABC transporter permease [Paludibacterium yongneupense]|uniref:amino acid ABC transporter permease n=1 Tax=Paludibacterium yongneupense TaxID=400061 RepID=UPI0003F4BB3F|nr:amino acid ABC transporter permease [Paludibacterium yongneupense]
MSVIDPGAWSAIADNIGYLLWGRAAEGEPGGLLLTLLIALSSGGIALLSGFALAVLAWFSPPALRRVLFLLADLVRGIPLLLLIFWFYFLLPLLMGKGAPDSASVVLALALFCAVSVMHIVLSGLGAVAAGQREAAIASGFGTWQTLRLVLLPQALPPMLPSLVNLFVALIKDTSMAFIVSVPELTLLTNQVNNRVMIYPLPLFFTAGALYFIVCATLAELGRRLERHLGRHGYGLGASA